MSIASSLSAAGINQDQFLQLLVTQLQHQDPLNPTDSSQFASQLAQFSTLDQLQQLNGHFSDMLSLQQLSGGSSLIGRTVSYQPTSGAAVQGVVSSLGVANGKVQLVINGTQVPLSQVTGVLS